MGIRTQALGLERLDLARVPEEVGPSVGSGRGIIDRIPEHQGRDVSVLIGCLVENRGKNAGRPAPPADNVK